MRQGGDVGESATDDSGPNRDGDSFAVPTPVPPDDPQAWYAPDVRAQDEVHPGVVMTIRERDC